VDILARARALNEEVKRVRNAKPPPECGEPHDGRYLHEVELTARGYSDLGQHGLWLDRELVLPDFSNPSKRAWPPYEVPLAAQVAESIQRNIRASPEQVQAAKKWWRKHEVEVRAEQEARAMPARQ
jgi:hypothetical protein